jgi:hypothetical protein
LRQSLLSKSVDLGLPLSYSESDHSADYYYQNEENVEPEYADRMSQAATQGLTTLDINEKKALMGKSSKFKPVPKMTKGKPTKSKRFLSREEKEMKSQIENDGFLRAFKEVVTEKSGGAGKKQRVKKKKKVTKNDQMKEQKGPANKSGDSGVFEESISPEGASVQKNELLLDLSLCTNSDDDSDEVDEEVVTTSSAPVVQNSPNTEAIESGTIAGNSLTQLKDKKGGRKLPPRKNKNKDICGTSTDVLDTTKPADTGDTQTGSAEE